MEEKTLDSVTRYVIRRVKEGDYYNGKGTFSNSYSTFEKAKVFNNIGGAKVTCLHLCERAYFYIHEMPELEVVEVKVATTNRVTPYDKFKSELPTTEVAGFGSPSGL